MDKKPKKELIDGIKDFLRDAEEPYDHREWRLFQRYRRRKQRKPLPLFVKLAGIAASLVLMVYASVKLVTLLDEPHIPLPATSKQATISRQIREVAPVDSGTTSGETKAQTPITTAPADVRIVPNAIQLPPPIERKENQHLREAISHKSAVLAHDRLAPPPTNMKSVPLPIFTTKLPQGAGRVKRDKPGKAWSPRLPGIQPVIGINVSPALTNKGFAPSGGVSMEVPLSGKISAEIGANYTAMTVGTDIEFDEPSTEGDYLVGVRNRIGMVAIPVAVNYAVSEHFAASLGIVPFRVVGDRRTDILQSYQWIRGGISSGDTTWRLVGNQVESHRRDSLYKGNNYLGFVQLSGRISSPWLRRHHTAIAPYIGIPIGTLRNDRYRWIHGGVSLRMYLR